jgi:DNA-binding protein HU-beta
MSQSNGMSRKEVVQVMARKTGLTKKTTAEFLHAFEELVVSEINAGRSLTLTGFGTFFMAERKPRKGINPNTKESMDIPGMPMPRFRAGSALKAAARKEGKR